VKDYATLIRAFAKVRAQRPARLMILGENTGIDKKSRRRSELHVLAANLGISEHVEFCGYCLNPYAFMSRAAVLVLSSLHEGFPNVLVEAMACGCPVVSTNCPVGPTEILEKGKHGTLVPVGDDTAMAHAIVDVLKHRPNASALKARAAAFSYEEAISRYEEALTGSTNVIPIRERRSARRAAGH
jgi:glycosyltransferase involved in cell wall biosynthesis